MIKEFHPYTTYCCHKCWGIGENYISIWRKDGKNVDGGFEVYCHHCFKLNELDFMKNNEYK